MYFLNSSIWELIHTNYIRLEAELKGTDILIEFHQFDIPAVSMYYEFTPP